MMHGPSHSGLRVATWNIHKGVQGLGPGKRLEIHNIGHAIEQLDADLVCLQEVRLFNHREARRFVRWPSLPQDEFLAPMGYEAVYRTNAFTRDGEHGNALLTRWPVLNVRHEDISDHRFEQRGLLHVQVQIEQICVHVLVVHLGLVPASRLRQIRQILGYVEREVPGHEPVVIAGDFNDWGTRSTRVLSLAAFLHSEGAPVRTYPSRMPLAQLDRVYARGVKPLKQWTPHGAIWRQMSDHLPLVVDLHWEWGV